MDEAQYALNHRIEQERENPLKGMKDGTAFYNLPISCHYCHKNMFYYMQIPSLHGKVLGEKGYCLDCYAQAVDVYLADKRLLNGSHTPEYAPNHTIDSETGLVDNKSLDGASK